MKKYKLFAFGASLMALMTTSCSDSFLVVEPPMQVTVEQYFTTEEHVYESLIAAYDPLQWPDWSMGQYNPVNIMADIMADDIWVGGSDKNDNQYWHLMMNYEALPTNCMTGLWTVAFSGVKRSNDVLTYIGWAQENMTQENQLLYAAEARVLRAFYYNWLWKFWGNIPFYFENLSFPYITAQVSADEVYNQVIADLEDIIAMNVLPMKASNSNQGRVTQAMTYMLYTEMVMYQNDESRFATALNYMNAIINSGSYDLVGDYSTDRKSVV